VQAAPPPLEETLVTGYVRLASGAEHRRIDLELRVLDIALAAVFGIVSGVSGATGGSHFVLEAGVAGAIASSASGAADRTIALTRSRTPQ